MLIPAEKDSYLESDPLKKCLLNRKLPTDPISQSVILWNLGGSTPDFSRFGRPQLFPENPMWTLYHKLNNCQGAGVRKRLELTLPCVRHPPDLELTPSQNGACCIIYVCSFSSATRECFSNLTSILPFMDPLPKSCPSDFFIHCVLKKIPDKM